MAVLASSVTGWYLVNHYSANIAREDVFPDESVRAAAGTGDAQNILVIGSDTRDGLSKKQRAALSTGNDQCNCTDTIMLFHQDKDSDGATVVSFPRDLMVKVPAWTSDDGVSHRAAVRQINTTYAVGGAKLLIRTLESMTDVRIDHYVQVKFAGVVDVVDALGGVDVCVPRAFDDRATKLALSTGSHELDGIDALKYVRLRHVGDGSDLGRIQRQQQFVVNALASATSTGVLANPFRLRHVLDAATRSVVLDSTFGTGELISFAGRLNTMDRGKLVLLTVPNEAYAPDPNRVQLQQPAADALFAKVKNNLPIKKASAKRSSVSTHARSGTSNPCAV